MALTKSGKPRKQREKKPAREKMPFVDYVRSVEPEAINADGLITKAIPYPETQPDGFRVQTAKKKDFADEEIALLWSIEHQQHMLQVKQKMLEKRKETLEDLRKYGDKDTRKNVKKAKAHLEKFAELQALLKAEGITIELPQL
jgi:hypothetical protein